MNNPFTELDELLRIPDELYFGSDRFIDAEALISTLSVEELPSLVDAWTARDNHWRERFAHAAMNIQPEVLAAFLPRALSSKESPSATLCLIGCLRKEVAKSDLGSAVVFYAVDIWSAHPSLRRQIQMATWSCGLSRRVLQSLGIASWRQAGL